MSGGSATVVLPDAGPLISLAYAAALDLLFEPGWPVEIVDELAIRELMSGFALHTPPKTGVFLSEDHKIAHASSCCRTAAARYRHVPSCS